MTAPDGITNDELALFIMADIGGPGATPAAGGDSESDFQPVLNTAAQSLDIVQWLSVSLEAGTYAAIWGHASALARGGPVHDHRPARGNIGKRH